LRKTVRTTRGSQPRAGLTQDDAGYFWGTTALGGTYAAGTVFKLNQNTGILTTVVEFTGAGENNRGAEPRAGLVSDGAGYFWGTTTLGGKFGGGTVFKVNANSGELSTVAEFEVADLEPNGQLVSDGAGCFWGTTRFGGEDGVGTVFKVNASTGVLTTVIEFPIDGSTGRGNEPIAGLVSDGAGSLLGTTTSGGTENNGTVFRVTPTSGELTALVDFNDGGGTVRGKTPYVGLAGDGTELMWGTTQHGGRGHGTIFKLNPTTGEVLTVVDFTGNGLVNQGSDPRATLVSDGAGYYWGSTSEGGAGGFGTIFKVNTSTGELTTVLNFSNDGPVNAGERPNAELVSDGMGYFWGTTLSGGATGIGTVFKVNAVSGALKTLVEFTNVDGDQRGNGPYAGLVSDGLGYLWGTTNRGGLRNRGTIFKIDTSTGAMTTVVDFTGDAGVARGTEPRAKLVADGLGSLWGTTSEGGLKDLGTIFKVDVITGILTTVREFSGADGAEPHAGLVLDGAGFFWGTTSSGGAFDQGTVFKISVATAELTTVLNFAGPGHVPNTGAYPGYGSLIRHTDGNLYGTTQEGGTESVGTIFRLRFGPTPVTEGADQIGLATARLRGSINPNGLVTKVWFEIGTDARLEGAAMWDAFVTGAGTSPESISQLAASLLPGTTYYYRIVGQNAENEIQQRGAILSFTTLTNSLPIVNLLGENPVIQEASNSYTDAGATAMDVEDGVLIPIKIRDTVLPAVPGVYEVTWSATDGNQQTGTATRVVNIVDTTKPVVMVPADVSVGTEEPGGAIVKYEPATASDLVGVTQIIYSPPSGSLFPLGTTKVIVTARDEAGNEGVGTFNVRVTLLHVAHQIAVLEGAGVPGAGFDPRLPAGAVWTTFGTPAISASGKLAFVGEWKSASASGKGLFIDGVLAARIGEPSPLTGATIRRFGEPAFSQDSDAVLIEATVAKSGATAEQTQVLLSFAPAAGLLAQAGRKKGGGENVEIGRLLGASLNSEGGLILTRLRGGRPAVNATNDLTVFEATPGGLVTLVRTGQLILGKTVRSLSLLKTIPGAPAQGRGDSSAAGVRFLVRFTDQTQAIMETAEEGDFIARASTGEAVDISGTGAYWSQFGPSLSSSSDGSRFAFRANTVAALNELAPATDGIFVGSATGFTRVVGGGDLAPNNLAASFAAFGEPVLSADGSSLAFLADLRAPKLQIEASSPFAAMAPWWRSQP
jgi:uncharacterized repeat protein (TIGR03803 family)